MNIEEGKNCPIFFSLEIFGDKWSLLILRDILHFDKQHYNEYLESEEGISTNILADRLKKLEKEGIISKKRDPANKKQFIYSPTKKCLDKMSICDYGFIAYFLDTEGNKVAIHSMSQQFLETYKYAFGSIHIVSFI